MLLLSGSEYFVALIFILDLLGARKLALKPKIIVYLHLYLDMEQTMKVT